MNSTKLSKQIPLITSKQKGFKLEYQVQKQGVIFLRRLRNKKFRIIFNVLQQQNVQMNENPFGDVNSFDELFLNNLSEQTNKQQQQSIPVVVGSPNDFQFKTQNLPRLNIHNSFKPISDNRVIVIMDCFIPPHSPPHLLIFGYLISSLILYHNFDKEFSSESSLTSLLCQFSKLLKATNIDQLNQNIKYKTGYQKMPYFLCLLTKDQNDTKSHKQFYYYSPREYQSLLNEFYRFREEQQHSRINYALETIIDYFPERASLGLEVAKNQDNSINSKFSSTRRQLSASGRKQVTQLGSQFEQTILGRQLFSFQFTASTIQSLAFELCHYFNSQEKLNLIETYNGVIANKKARMEIQYSDRYLQLVRQKIFLNNRIQLFQFQMIESQLNKSIFPISEIILTNILYEIKQTVRSQMLQDAVNCMSLQEFILNQKKVVEKIATYEQQLMLLNAESGLKFVNECYSMVEINQKDISLFREKQNSNDDELALSQQSQQSSTSFNNDKQTIPHHLQQPIPPQQIRQLFTILTTRIQSFNNQCSSLFTYGDKISQAYMSAFDKLANEYLSIVGDKLVEFAEKIEIRLREQQLSEDTVKYQLKTSLRQQKLLEQQYQLQLLIQAELKQQLKSLILNTQLNNSSSNYTQNSNHSYYQTQQQQPLSSSQLSSSSLKSQPPPHSNHFITFQKQIHKLKRKIQLLQQQSRDKDNHIQQLTQLLNKFQFTSKSLPDNKYQDKFNSTTKQLVGQANSQIKKFYTILQQVKQVEKHYEQAKKLLLKQRAKIIQQKSQSLKQLKSVKQESQKVKIQNKKLYEIVVDEKKAIQNFNALKQTLKQHIAQLQSFNTQLKCSLAQEEGNKELYRKALSLAVEHCQKGKSQNLSKFYKFLEHQQIKEMIKPLVGRK